MASTKVGKKALDDDPMNEPDLSPEVDGMPEGGEGASSGEEPYGAQIWRRVHRDLSVLMQEYDEMIRLCEHEHVNGHLVELLQHLGEHLDHIEGAMGEHYGHLDPIEGAMSSEDRNEPEMEEEAPAEEEEALDEDLDEAEDEENEVAEDEVENEEAPAEEAVETLNEEEDEEPADMKGLYKRTKQIRKDVKTLTGKNKVKTYKNKPRRARKAIDPDELPPEEEEMEEGDGPVDALAEGDLPPEEEMLDEDDLDSNGVDDDDEQDFHKGLKSHHHIPVRDAEGFLKGLPEWGHDWSDERRMESFYHHKTLGNIADELEGKTDNPDGMDGKGLKKKEKCKTIVKHKVGRRKRLLGKKSIPGDTQWAEEEAMEPQHKNADCCKALRGCSGFFKSLSTHHSSLADEHLSQALEHHAALAGLLQEVEKDALEDAETVPAEMGEIQEKAMRETFESQHRQLQQLAHQLNGLSSMIKV